MKIYVVPALVHLEGGESGEFLFQKFEFHLLPHSPEMNMNMKSKKNGIKEKMWLLLRLLSLTECVCSLSPWGEEQKLHVSNHSINKKMFLSKHYYFFLSRFILLSHISQQTTYIFQLLLLPQTSISSDKPTITNKMEKSLPYLFLSLKKYSQNQSREAHLLFSSLQFIKIQKNCLSPMC